MSLYIPPLAASTALQPSAPAVAHEQEKPQETGATFHDLCRAKQLETFGGFDLLVLTTPDEELIGNMLRHWRLGENVYFFDLIALEMLQGLDGHPDLKREFLELYKDCVHCAELEALKLEPFSYDNLKPRISAFRSKMTIALIKAMGSDRSPVLVGEARRMEQTLKLFQKLLEGSGSRRLFTNKTLSFYYESAPRAAISRDQQAYFIRLIRSLSPSINQELDPEAFLNEPPSRFYRRLVAIYDRIHEEVKEIGLRVKGRGCSWTKEDAVRTGMLNAAVRRIGNLKKYFEENLLSKDRALIESRGLESLLFYSYQRCFSKSMQLQEPFDEIVKRIEDRLGDNFEAVLNKILDKKKLDPWMRDLTSFDNLRAIMAELKREIKTLHEQASQGRFGDPSEIEVGYRDCFDTLSALFIALHDMVATQNANYDQLRDRHLPDDLVACADLAPSVAQSDRSSATPSPTQESPVQDQALLVSASSTALLPAVQELEPAPSPVPSPVPSPTQAQAPAVPRFRAKSDADSFERKEVAPPPRAAPSVRYIVPKTGEKPGKVGKFLLAQGFHLYKSDNHRYYCHSGVRVKISSHDTLSPGVRQEIIDALNALADLDALA